MNSLDCNVNISVLSLDDCKTAAEIEKICLNDEGWNENGIKEALEHGTLYLGAFCNGVLAGHLGASIVLDECYINNVAILPKYRRKGLALALLNELIAKAKEKEIAFISLEVRESNEAAIALYKKLNFEIKGLRKGFYKNPTESALIMTLDLK